MHMTDSERARYDEEESAYLALHRLAARLAKE